MELIFCILLIFSCFHFTLVCSMCPPLVVLLRSDAELFCLFRSAQLLPSLLSALCSDALFFVIAVRAPLRRFGRVSRAQKKFARNPHPSLTPLRACFPACNRSFSGLSVRALHAPLQRFGRGSRAQKKFARNPHPSLTQLRLFRQCCLRSAPRLFSGL